MTVRSITLQRARMLSPKVRELTFDPGPGFAFEPGQWVSLKVPRPPPEYPLPRSYSIASAPRADGAFDVAVTRVENGPGSGFLHAMRVGDAIDCAPPAGFFTLPAVRRTPLLLVGTGTGVAPLRAMIQRLAADDDAPPTTLLFGVRHQEDLLYRDEFSALAARDPRFRFEPTLSRPDGAWGGRAGYVQTHLPELLAHHPDADVYVCGLSAMVRDARSVLRDTLGLPRGRVHSERFD
jgi:CDP-4-dehydro-6-deoxyglucose reductase, E3